MLTTCFDEATLFHPNFKRFRESQRPIKSSRDRGGVKQAALGIHGPSSGVLVLRDPESHEGQPVVLPHQAREPVAAVPPDAPALHHSFPNAE